MHSFIAIFTSILLITGFSAWGQEISEEERLKGFAEHNRRKEQFEKQRLVGSDEVKKKREDWEKERQKAVDPYKIWKSKQGTAPDENSPEYRKDLEAKEQRQKELEKARLEYVKARDAKKARRQSTVRLTEEEEYELSTDQVNRIDPSKRKNAAGKGGSAGRSSSPGMGSADFGSPPPMDFGSPPPPPPPPEFYEPEIPPPPPPPDAGFEDPIPPPVFDEPSDM